MTGARVAQDFERVIEAVRQRVEGGIAWAVKRWKRHRIGTAAAAHPVFQPPFRRGDEALSAEQARANFAYFESQKRDRLAHLRFLMGKFGVEVVNAGTVDRFVAAWGDVLMLDEGCEAALTTHEPKWTHGYGGLNIVHDLAVYTGEAAIRSDGRWRWVQGSGAGGCGAVLSDGVRQVDVIGEVGRVMRDGDGRREGLARVRGMLEAR